MVLSSLFSWLFPNKDTYSLTVLLLCLITHLTQVQQWLILSHPIYWTSQKELIHLQVLNGKMDPVAISCMVSAKECVEIEGEKEQSFMDVVYVICSNNDRLLHKVEDSFANVPDIISRISTFISKKIIHPLMEYNQYIFSYTSQSHLFCSILT